MQPTLSRPQPVAATATHTGRDRSLAMLRTGYPYLLNLRGRWDAVTLELRVLGRRTTVVSGAAGVRLFYNEAIMQRRGAVPAPLRRTLFGAGAVHGLDDDAHKQRKALFLDLLTADAAREIAMIAGELWNAPARDDSADPAQVFDAAVTVHCAAICRWAGIPADMVDLNLGRDLVAMVDGFGSVGPRHFAARRARRRTNRWARRLIARVRGGHRSVDPDCALGKVARYANAEGKLLPNRVAAVELLNVLRPTVAVAYFVAFAAHALQAQPKLRDYLAADGDDAYEAFAHELRRFYPFVPMLAARVRRSVTFQGRTLPRGRRVLLDVYGTLHDPNLWTAPAVFDPDRFRHDETDCAVYIPQGGGDVTTGHRCPGERIAVELIKIATRRIVETPHREPVPTRIPMDRMPTRPFAVGG